jgi:hypothetical protein
MKSTALFACLTIFAACSPGRSLSTPSYGVKVSKDMREDALMRARVWNAPSVSIEFANLLEAEEGPKTIRSSDEIACKWDHFDEPSGATPKFRCATESGENLKVKYSKKTKNNNPEIPAEIAASRLLRVLGFGADLMYTAKRVRCAGCPSDPWMYSTQLHSPFEEIRKRFLWTYGKPDRYGNYTYQPDFSKHTDFTYVSIERKFGEQGIEYKNNDGWKWNELQKISAARGGSSRAEIDGLILMAVFLQHTDNKRDQQRVVCMTKIEQNGYCAQPMLIMQDVGATFGGLEGLGSHKKFDLERWKKAEMWEDRASCTVDVDSAALVGSFKEVQISEAGRQFLSGLLNRLSDRQIYDLFKGARADEFKNNTSESINEWVQVFKQHRQAMTEGAPCPQ